MRGEVWLELFEQDEYKSDLVLLGQLLQRCLLDPLHVKMQVSVWLKDIWLGIQHVIKELSQEEGSSLVLLLRLVELSLKALMLLEKCVILLLLHDHVFLGLLQLLL